MVKTLSPGPVKFQCRINIVSMLWINIEITLIQLWKWSKIRCRIFNVAQRWYNEGVRRWHNVETTWYKFFSTLLQRCLNVSKSYIKTLQASDEYGFVNRQFYSAKYFLQDINNSTANRLITYCSNFLGLVHIVQDGKNGDAHRSSKFWKFKTQKPPWKSRKLSWSHWNLWSIEISSTTPP